MKATISHPIYKLNQPAGKKYWNGKAFTDSIAIVDADQLSAAHKYIDANYPKGLAEINLTVDQVGITKEQFLAGVQFKVLGEIFDYQHIDGALYKCLIDGNHYCGNVKNVTEYGFMVYAYLFTSEVQATVTFSDCTIITDESK